MYINNISIYVKTNEKQVRLLIYKSNSLVFKSVFWGGKILNRKNGVSRTTSKNSLSRRIIRSWQLYVLIIPTVVYLIIFKYWPMYGVLIAFKDFKPYLGILGSPWVGLKHFERFLRSPNSLQLIWNTVALSVYGLLAGFPIPIFLALGMNYLKSVRFKKTMQTITYAPHFISVVVMVGIINVFLSPSYGAVNVLLEKIGLDSVDFLTDPKDFRDLYVWTGVWQSMGWSSIIYLAALSVVSPELHEAAIVDGAVKIQRIIHIDIPTIAPTIIILLILQLGRIMNIGFEKAFLMQNDLNAKTSEIISTYVYKRGIVGAQYSFSGAVGLFNSVVNMTILVSVNFLSKKVSGSSLW